MSATQEIPVLVGVGQVLQRLDDPREAAEPPIAHAACLSDDGWRTWGTLDDRAVMKAMTREEFRGRRGHLDGAGKLRVDPA